MRYDTKPSDDEVQVLESWGIWNTPSLPLLSGPLWPEVVVLVRVSSMGQIELFNHLVDLKLWKCWIGLFVLDSRIWKHLIISLDCNSWKYLTVCKQMNFNNSLKKNWVTYKLFWGCRIHRLHLFRVVRLSQRVSWHDTKLSDGETPVMLELWGMQSTSFLPLFPGSLFPGLVAPDRVLSMGQTALFEIEVFLDLTVCKQKLYLC